MKVGDLIMYNSAQDPAAMDSQPAVGLCLREEEDRACDDEVRMLVLWFDDWLTTHEDLDACAKSSWMDVLSESR